MMDDINLKSIDNYNEIALIDFRIFESRENESYEGIYGVNVAKVQSIIEWPEELFDVPASPDYVLGLFDLRGLIIPLIDLSKWLNITPDTQKHRKKVIISEFNNVKIGFVVHDVNRIRRINWKDVEAARFSYSGVIERGKITGTTQIDDGKTLLILDLESIVDELDFYEKKADQIVEIVEDHHKFSGLALVLEDSKIARKRVVANLVAMGFQVIEAIDGQEGKEKLEKLAQKYGNELKNNLKIIISDVEMPRMDGFHFANEIKKDKRFENIPILFNSSICDANSMERGKKSGADGYVVKFDPNVFYQEIKNILG